MATSNGKLSEPIGTMCAVERLLMLTPQQWTQLFANKARASLSHSSIDRFCSAAVDEMMMMMLADPIRYSFGMLSCS